jgi:phosphotransferase system HPr (HPr) family protein
MTASREVVFCDRYGLHPRAAMRISQAAARFGARITLEDLTAGGAPVDGRSMLTLVGAAIRAGDRVRVAADGDDAEAAVEAVATLLESGVCHPGG